MPQQNAPHDVIFEVRGALGLLTLNRPQALNALNTVMVDAMVAALRHCAGNDAITAVAITGAGGKAFCAGGDIRLIHDLGKAGRQAEALDFWAREYRLNAMIHRFPKPYIALIDGVVMGGGVGVSLHGSHRLAGPNYLFAMPEVGIGFFPDVGATYALPRLPGAMGTYLAVTGARLRRADALALGLATHSITGEETDTLLDALAAGQGVEAVLPRFHEAAGEAPIMAQRAAIDHHFGKESLAAIIASLEAAGPEDGFAAQTLAQMQLKSPLSMAISFEQMRRGRGLDFAAAMALEYRIVSRIVYGHDFYEGVRALLIDRDNRPRWQPDAVAGVTPAMVAAYFAPLSPDLDVAGA